MRSSRSHGRPALALSRTLTLTLTLSLTPTLTLTLTLILTLTLTLTLTVTLLLAPAVLRHGAAAYARGGGPHVRRRTGRAPAAARRRRPFHGCALRPQLRCPREHQGG